MPMTPSARCCSVTTRTSATSSTELCGTVNAPMRKGALAQIEVDRPLEAGGGTLRWLIPPDALKPKR